jgi:hypothetical protein
MSDIRAIKKELEDLRSRIQPVARKALTAKEVADMSPMAEIEAFFDGLTGNINLSPKALSILCYLKQRQLQGHVIDDAMILEAQRG